MPNIPTYQPRVSSPRPGNGQSRAAASLGESARSAITSIGSSLESTARFYYQQKAQKETSKLTSDYAQTFSGLTQNWNEAAKSADPNIDFAEQWRQEVLEPTLDKFGGEDLESREGEELRTRLTSNMRLHFFDKTSADEAAISGHAVQTNLEQAGNALSQAAYADPSSMDASIAILHEALEAQIGSHKVTAAQAAAIRDDVGGRLAKGIATAAGRGMAETNPEALQKAITEGKFNKYLDGGDTATLNTYAIQQQKAQEADARRAKQEAIQDANLASDAQRNKYMQSFADPKTGRVSIPKGTQAQILADPVMSAPDKDALLGIVKRLSDDENGSPETWRTNQGLYLSLYGRIHLPDRDPRKITDEDELNQYLGPDKLNPTALSQLKGEVNGRRTEEGRLEGQQKQAFINMVKSQLTGANPLLGIRDPAGEQVYSRWLQQFLGNYDKAVRGGGVPAELLKENGPFDLGWKHLKRSPQQFMLDMMQDNTGNLNLLGPEKK